MGGSAAQYTFQFGTLSFRNKGRDAKSNIEIFILALSPELRGDPNEWYSVRHGIMINRFDKKLVKNSNHWLRLV